MSKKTLIIDDRDSLASSEITKDLFGNNIPNKPFVLHAPYKEEKLIVKQSNKPCKGHIYKEQHTPINKTLTHIYRVCTKCGFSQYKGEQKVF